MGELTLCGPCLGVILSEADPGRRRSLAGIPRLPDPVAERLVVDPDPGVRARLAGREDLPDPIAARFSDPASEPSPVVWRSFAATRTGATYAGSLLGTGDRLTLLVLATNPSTPSDVLDRLAQHHDTVIAGTVTATRTGRPPDDEVIAEVLGARAVPTRPLAEAPAGTVWPGAPLPAPQSSAVGEAATPPSALPRAAASGRERAGDDQATPANSRGLVIGFAVVAVVVVVLVAVIGFGGGSGDGSSSDTAGVSLAAGGSTVVATSAPDGSPSTGAPSSSSPSTSARRGGTTGEALVLDLTMTAQTDRFCDVAEVTIGFNGPTAHVVITDDADRELWSGPWDPGQHREIDLVAPSERLHARVVTTADPDDFRPSGSVEGTFC